jgi:DNA-binding transcriptional ArsR family regulator
MHRRTDIPGASHRGCVHLDLPFVSTYGDAGLGLLGDPSRRAIFELLARGPRSVQELADELPISRPAVSQHLKVLRDGGLVVSRAVGNRRIYQLNPNGVTALRAWLEGVWSDALTGFQKTAESTTPDITSPDEELS